MHNPPFGFLLKRHGYNKDIASYDSWAHPWPSAKCVSRMSARPRSALLVRRPRPFTQISLRSSHAPSSSMEPPWPCPRRMFFSPAARRGKKQRSPAAPTGPTVKSPFFFPQPLLATCSGNLLIKILRAPGETWVVTGLSGLSLLACLKKSLRLPFPARPSCSDCHRHARSGLAREK